MKHLVVIKGCRCPRSGTGKKNSTLRKLLELYHGVKSAKNKMLEADPNLERSITVHLSIDTMFASYRKLMQ